MVRTYKKLPRRAGKQGKKRTILWWLALLTVFSVGLVFLLRNSYRWLCKSNFFRISSVHISGCQRITKEEIRGLANLDIHSNLLAIDVDDIGRRLEMHPWVKRAVVRRELPDCLYIRIVEKQPVAILQDRGLYYVDKEGMIITRISLVENMDYPVITGFKKVDFVSNPEKLMPLRRLLPVLYTKNDIEDILPARNISEIHMDPKKGLILYTVDGLFPIRLGRGDIGKKFRYLEKVLYDLYLKKDYDSASYVDCEYYGGRVMVRKNVNAS